MVVTVASPSVPSTSLTWPHTSVMLPSLLYWDQLTLSRHFTPSFSKLVSGYARYIMCYYFCLVEPVDPVRSEDITLMDVKSDSVIIQWTVPYISYSPETYVVQYGTSRDSLIHNSSSTDSEEEVMTYSVELSGLRDNTTYYVQVLATNTAQRSNRSTVHTFITLPLEPGMQSILGDLKEE